MVLNAAKCQSYSSYRFSVIKGKPAERVKGKYPRLGKRVDHIPTKIEKMEQWGFDYSKYLQYCTEE